MRLSRSLLGQIIVANVATFIAAAILVPIVSTRLLDRVAVKYQRLALRTQADGIADELRSQPGKNLSLPRGANLDLNFADAFAGHSFAVLAQNGEVLLASGETGVTLQTAPRANRTVFFRRGPILSVSLPADISGRRCWIIASHDLRSPGAISDDIVGGFSSRLLLLLAPTFALLLLLNLFLVWGTVTAIQRASRVAESIGSADHDRRVHPGSLPMEIAPLAEAMNGALDRLQSSLRSRSAFIANVAHELRTPLATFKLKLETVTDSRLRDELKRVVDRAGHVVAQLFDLAMLEDLAVRPDEEFDLVDTARSAVETMLPLVIERGKSIALEAPERAVRVHGRAQLAMLAITNLVDNASRHTPEGTFVGVEVTDEGRVVVADNGPGIDADEPGSNAERFRRRDHRRSDSAGLGLAIVRRVMAAHQGLLEIANGPDAGARLTLVFRPI